MIEFKTKKQNENFRTYHFSQIQKSIGRAVKKIGFVPERSLSVAKSRRLSDGAGRTRGDGEVAKRSSIPPQAAAETARAAVVDD